VKINSPASAAPCPLALFHPANNVPTVWGRTPTERASRQLKNLKIPITQEAPPSGTTALLVVRDDVIFHQSVLKGLKDHPGTALVDDLGRPLAAHLATSTPEALNDVRRWLDAGGVAPSDLRSASAADIADLYNAALRRRDDPYALRVDAGNLAAIEKRIFLATYKGVTDLVTKYWWPLPARFATKACVRLGLTPNLVTSVSGILAVAVCFQFAKGNYGLGLAMAWPMIFLDTVDGKLARVTLNSSKFGDVLDHGIDLIHPPVWYLTWGFGLAGSLGEHFVPLMWILFGAYAAGRLCEGVFARRFGFHVHVWRPFDSAFRLILARRNPNLILLTLSWIAGHPAWGLWAITAWTLITLAVQLVQTVQSTLAARRGRVRSWLEMPPAAPAPGP
jgi:phosphatidylglycerophosphate synthase